MVRSSQHGSCSSVPTPRSCRRRRFETRSSAGWSRSLPRERARGHSAADRLGRMLVVVPYLVQHPGAELAEAARVFGIDERELHDDLMLLFMAGLPPYAPGDLIEVDIEEGHVW